jgi:hypothetical protein
MTDEKNKLGPDSTMREIFDYIRPDTGCKVQAVKLEDRDDGRVDFMLMITGTEAEAAIITANLMSYTDEMYQIGEKIESGEIVPGEDGKTSDEPNLTVVP